MNESYEKFAHEAKALFDNSVEELDAATLSTLNRSRHRALQEIGSQHANWMRWAPAAGVAAVVVVAVMLAVPRPGDVDVLPASVTDMEILLSEDSLEMLEDLEFYRFIDLLEQESDVS
jgi:hypothetical protein